MMNLPRLGHPRSIASGSPRSRNRVRCSSLFGSTTSSKRSDWIVFRKPLPANREKCATSKSNDWHARKEMGITADGALARRGCVRLAALQCFGPGSGQRSYRRPRGAAEPAAHSGRRSPHHDVSPRGVGSLVALGPGEFHLAVPSHLYFALRGEEQPVSASARRHLSRADALHRMTRHQHHRIPLRCSGDRWPRLGRGSWRGGILQPRRGTQPHAQQGSVYRAVDVAPDHSTRP